MWKISRKKKCSGQFLSPKAKGGNAKLMLHLLHANGCKCNLKSNAYLYHQLVITAKKRSYMKINRKRNGTRAMLVIHYTSITCESKLQYVINRYYRNGLDLNGRLKKCLEGVYAQYETKKKKENHFIRYLYNGVERHVIFISYYFSRNNYLTIINFNFFIIFFYIDDNDAYYG